MRTRDNDQLVIPNEKLVSDTDPQLHDPERGRWPRSPLSALSPDLRALVESLKAEGKKCS